MELKPVKPKSEDEIVHYMTPQEAIKRAEEKERLRHRGGIDVSKHPRGQGRRLRRLQLVSPPVSHSHGRGPRRQSSLVDLFLFKRHLILFLW